MCPFVLAEALVVVQDIPNIQIPAPPKEVSPPPTEYKPTKVAVVIPFEFRLSK